VRSNSRVPSLNNFVSKGRLTFNPNLLAANDISRWA
jgi:hypothetical protein